MQQAVAEAINYYDCTPSYAQAVRMRNDCGEQFCILTRERVYRIMGEEKANQREKVSFPMKELRKFFPEDCTTKDMQNTILRLLEEEHRRKQRSRDYER